MDAACFQNYQPVLVKGIVNLFDMIAEDIYKVCLISVSQGLYSEDNVDIPPVVQETLQQFSEITDISSMEFCLKFINTLKSIPEENWEILKKFKTESSIFGK